MIDNESTPTPTRPYPPYDTRPMNGGEQRRYRFDNGYEASVVRGPYTYGGPSGMYELAVMLNGHLNYETPITDDVLGYLSEDDVQRTLAEIEALPPAGKGSL
jgi:hypothetical protein